MVSTSMHNEYARISSVSHSQFCLNTDVHNLPGMHMCKLGSLAALIWHRLARPISQAG